MKSFYLAAVAALIAHQASAQEVTALSMQPGMVHIARMSAPFASVVVGDPEIADVTTMTDQRLAITAKKDGYLSILFLAEDKSMVGQLNVTVVLAEQFGRTQVRVTRFSRGKDDQPQPPLVSTYNCEKGGPCHPEAPQQPININVSTGPVITGEAIKAAKGKK